MSLINDALKKAQRSRHDVPATDAPPVPGGGDVKIAKRAQPRSANTMVLLGGGVLALILLSVAVTVYLLKRPSASAPSPVAATAPAPTAPGPHSPSSAAPATPKTDKLPGSAVVEPKSVAVAPSTPPPAVPVTRPATPPAPTPTTASGATPAIAAADRPVPPAPRGEPPSSTPSANSVATTPATPPPLPVPAAIAPAPAARPDERVSAYVEAVKVTGIRSSGTESRVLMNERVYRVGDTVDRTLNIRLIKVAVDSLTFADANGVNYIKYF